MESLNALISDINAYALGPPMLILLGATGVFLAVGTVFVS